MRKNLSLFYKRDDAVSSPLEFIVAFAVVIIAFSLFFSAVGQMFTSYEPRSKGVDYRTKSMEISERLMKDVGMLKNGNTNWESDPGNMTFLGLGAHEILSETSLSEEEGYSGGCELWAETNGPWSAYAGEWITLEGWAGCGTPPYKYHWEIENVVSGSSSPETTFEADSNTRDVDRAFERTGSVADYYTTEASENFEIEWKNGQDSSVVQVKFIWIGAGDASDHPELFPRGYPVNLTVTDNVSDTVTSYDMVTVYLQPEPPPSTKIKIVPSTKTVNQGQMFEVNVEIDPGEPISSVNFSLSFDPDLLQANSISDGVFDVFTPGSIDNVGGFINGSNGSMNPPRTVSTPDVIATISFTAHSDSLGTTTLDLFNLEALNATGVSVPVVNVDGSITVQGSGLTLTADANGPYSGYVGEKIWFYGSASGGTPPYDWFWEFGDGSTSSLQNPTHTYNLKGAYTVNLTVNDSDSSTATDTTLATVSSGLPPPISPNSTCCFPAGTQISMADGSRKNIEDIQVGDQVLSYDVEHQCFVNSSVVHTTIKTRRGVYDINGGVISPTDDHPLYVRKPNGMMGWAAINPDKSEVAYGYRDAIPLRVGDQLLKADGTWMTIKSIEFKPGSLKTYTFTVDSLVHDYFANDFLVSNPELRGCPVEAGNPISPIHPPRTTCIGASRNAPGIPIYTKSYTNISDIKVGDAIKCYNPKTDETVDGTVVKVFKYQADEIIRVDGVGMVPDHQIKNNGIWTRSDKLTIDNSRSVERITGSFTTYNLQVEPYNNYFYKNQYDELVLTRGTTEFDTPIGVDLSGRASRTGGSSLDKTGRAPSHVKYTITDDGRVRLFDSGVAYGVLDPYKIKALKDEVSYNLAKESLLGPDSMYDFNISITSRNGTQLLSYGKGYKVGEIVSSFSRNVMVFPNIEAKMTIFVFR